MINLHKFYTATQAEGFSLDDVPIALRDAIMYSYADAVRLADIRYNDGTKWVQGFVQPMLFASAPQAHDVSIAACCVTVYDGTTNKLGIIFGSSDAEYNTYKAMMDSQGMRQAIADAFGYHDAILITGPVGDARVYAASAGENDYRQSAVIPTYSTLYVSDVNWRTVDKAAKPDIATVIGSPFPGEDLTIRNPVMLWTASNGVRFSTPIEHFYTDLENVATINTKCDTILGQRVKDVKSSIDGQIETLTTAFGSVAELIGTLSVFGNTVKDVTNKYNTISQYIPRP
jgi:hypothetical protein